jgi:hypothetical protein
MKEKETRYCKCGCGQEVPTHKSRRIEYVRGHNGRRATRIPWPEVNQTLVVADPRNWYQIDEHSNQQEGVMAIASQEESAEDRLIKNDLFSRLSAEARYVIDLCLNSPREILSKNWGAMIDELAAHLYLQKKWSLTKTKESLLEVTDFVENF